MLPDYDYDEITTIYLPKTDWHYLAHQGSCEHLPVVYPFQPVAKRTRSQVAKLKKHIALMKSIPRLREIQESDRARRAQRAADVAAGRPVSPLPERVYITANDRKRLARDKRERRSWQQLDLVCRRKKNPLAERSPSDSGSSTHSEGCY
jgi:hypothetical protein